MILQKMKQSWVDNGEGRDGKGFRAQRRVTDAVYRWEHMCRWDGRASTADANRSV